MPARTATRSKTAARPAKAPAKAAGQKGLSVKSFTGLNKKRMESKANKNFGKRLLLKQGDTVPVQFLQDPTAFREFEQHVFQEDGRWNYVPCLGDACPLCEDESDTKSKTSYQFVCNVYNFKERKVQIMGGPKDLAQRIFYRYERKPAMFLKRSYEVTKFPTSPVSYSMDVADEAIVRTTGLKLYDLDEYLLDEAKRFYGDELPDTSALDADDTADALDEDELEDVEDIDEEDDDLVDEDEDDEDLDDEEDDLDDEDEDDDDLDDEDDEDDLDEDDEDEEDEPAPARRAPAKKAAAKAPAKKAATRRR